MKIAAAWLRAGGQAAGNWTIGGVVFMALRFAVCMKQGRMKLEPRLWVLAMASWTGSTMRSGHSHAALADV